MPKPETLDIGALYAAFKDVRLHIGLVVDEVRIGGQGAHLVREPFSINLDQEAEAEAEISQASIARFLDQTAPGGLRSFNVKLDAGQAFVNATMTMLVPIPVSAVCTLRIHEGTKLFVDLVEVNVLGAGPTNLVQKQLDAINPIIDTADLPLNIVLDSVEIADGKALLKGRLSPK